ncbi:MAG: ubiquitin carboxyl-terminal hydrolase [Bacteroidota bacterium]
MMPTQGPRRLIKRMLISTTYACWGVIGLESCHSCHRERGAIVPRPSETTTDTTIPNESNKRDGTAPNPNRTITVLRGIPNIGNTCYINSVLQIIARFYPDTFKDKSNALAVAGQVIIDKLNDDRDHVKREEAKAFRDCLVKHKGNNFEIKRQEDADECLLTLLEDNPIISHSHWNRKITYLPNCPYRNHHFWQEQKEFASIKLFFPEDARASIDMGTLLAHAYADEALVGENQCEDAILKKKADAINQTRLEIHDSANLPLIIQLMRTLDPNKKDLRNVTNTMSLTIPVGIQHSYRTAPTELNYHLHGFIVHWGSTPNAGHYVAYIRQDNGQWRSYNDDKVVNVTLKRATKVAQQAYLYFYRTAP